MDRDPLINLLRQADATAAAPTGRADVARDVRRRFARRRRVRRAAGACAVACGVVFVASVAVFRHEPETPERVAAMPAAPPVQSAPDIAAIRAELALLERECETREAAVERALASTRARTSPATDALEDLRWQREQAALVLVRQGDRLANDLSLPRPAAVAYRSARDTFPDTRWGAVARARLGEPY